MNENQKDQSLSEASENPVENLPESLEAQLVALRTDRDQLLSEKADLADRLLRRQADLENFRRRVERERSEYVQFAAMDLVRQLLPVLDDFERAAKVETADKEYQKGIDLIYQQLASILKKSGLEPFESVGEPFDPNLHQAVDRVQSEEVAGDTVLQEYQRGYNFKGKLLRPAMVKVAIKP